MSDYPMLISNKLHSFRNFIRQTGGFYRIQSLQDQKFISVSGNNTFDGTPLYLATGGEPHYFGVYFDSDKYAYPTS